jgi:pimeloyl-ACP methyl ester carboxylesterase
MAAGRVAPELFDVDVAGGALRVGRFGAGPSVALGIHGITGSLMQLVPVARRLPPGWAMVAPDLRGRGASNGLPAPYGMEAHAADCAAVIRATADGPVVVLGESMGAYVAVVLAARHPELVSRLVLADGGLPLPVPAGADPDAVVEAVLGPALARLRQVFATPEDYLAFWRAHPAVGREWNDDVEAYLGYDLEPVPGGLRPRAREDAVRVDGGEHIADPGLVDGALRQVRCPVTLVRAERNLLDGLPALLPDDAVAPWRGRLDAFDDVLVEDTNHYTLMLGRRGAALLAELVSGGEAKK